MREIYLTMILLQVWIDVDEAEKRIHIGTLSLATPKVERYINDLLRQCNSEISLIKQGCRPLFVLLRDGNAVFAVDGVNTPQIDLYMRLNLPPTNKVKEFNE